MKAFRKIRFRVNSIGSETNGSRTRSNGCLKHAVRSVKRADHRNHIRLAHSKPEEQHVVYRYILRQSFDAGQRNEENKRSNQGQVEQPHVFCLEGSVGLTCHGCRYEEDSNGQLDREEGIDLADEAISRIIEQRIVFVSLTHLYIWFDLVHFHRIIISIG
jgi:hypothetical protein